MTTTATDAAQVQIDKIDKAASGKMCCAFFCQHDSIVTTFPDCIGTYDQTCASPARQLRFPPTGAGCGTRGQVNPCCLTDLEQCIAVGGIKARGFDESKHKCIMLRGWATCVKPPILSGGPLCKGLNHFACIETRYALPCDEDIPCMFGCCFVICFQNWKFQLEYFKPATATPGLRAMDSIGGIGGPDLAEMER